MVKQVSHRAKKNSDYRSSRSETVCLDLDGAVLLIVDVTVLDKEYIALKIKPLSHCG